MRWRSTVYGLRWIGVSMALCLAPSCGNSERTVEIQVANTVYQLPKSHLLSNLTTPRRFVRISTPERPFDLVHDSRNEGKFHRNGTPVLFSVSEHPALPTERHSVDGIAVMCRVAASPIDGCAFQLPHGEVSWTVLLPKTRLRASRTIREEAVSALEGYRLAALADERPT